MGNLDKIMDEIELFGERYRKSNNEEQRKTYNQYIELIIMNHADRTHQFDLYNYWDRLKK